MAIVGENQSQEQASLTRAIISGCACPAGTCMLVIYKSYLLPWILPFFILSHRSFLESLTFNSQSSYDPIALSIRYPLLSLYLWGIFVNNSWSKRFLWPLHIAILRWPRVSFKILWSPLSSVAPSKEAYWWFDLTSSLVGRWYNKMLIAGPAVAPIILVICLPCCLLPHHEQIIIHEHERASIELRLKMLLVYIKDEDIVRCMFRDTLDSFCLRKLPLILSPVMNANS